MSAPLQRDVNGRAGCSMIGTAYVLLTFCLIVMNCISNARQVQDISFIGFERLQQNVRMKASLKYRSPHSAKLSKRYFTAGKAILFMFIKHISQFAWRF